MRVSSRSTLVLDGSGIQVESLDLDGALIVRARNGARVTIRTAAPITNAGHRIVTLSDADAPASPPESIRIRAFAIVRDAERVVEFNEPGDYVLSE